MANVRDLNFSSLPDDDSFKMPKLGDLRSLNFESLPSEPLSPLQAGGALASGFNRAVTTGLPGLPVKTALDVADLARSAYGFVGHKVGALSADEMPELLDRSRMVGSPEWIAAKIESNPYGAAAINNPRPDDPTARTLNAGGYGIGAGMSGRPADAAMNFASGTAGQLAAEGGASPEWAMVAGMSPQVAVTGSAAATRGAFRGGDEGRREMVSRLEDFRRAGVEPTVGLATGNRRTQAAESMLAKTPGGAGVMAKASERIIDQLGDSAGAVRDRVSAQYGPVAAGDAIKGGVSQYRQRQQDIYGEMQDRAVSMIPQGMRFPADQMVARGANTLADIEGAPQVSRVLNEPLGFTQRTVRALQDDAAGKPRQPIHSRILDENGQPIPLGEAPGTPGGLPFEALKGLRSRVGEVAYADNPLLVDRNTGAMRQLYAGAKADLMNAGRLADAERVAQGQQPGVARRLDRADKFYTATQKVLEDTLAPLFKAGDPASEKAYYRLEADLRTAGQQAQRAMASLPLDVRKQVTATAVDRMGRAAPGQQSAAGDAFSPQTFLTNWNKIKPEGKAALFGGIPSGDSMRGKLDAIARSAEMIRKANAVYSNPSGTAQAVNLTGAGIGALSGAVGLVTGNPTAGMTALGSVLGSMALGNASARYLFTNPKFVTWLSQTTTMKPEQMNQHLRRLALNATQEKDADARAELEDFVNAYRSELE